MHWQCRALCTHPTDQAQPQQPKFMVEGNKITVTFIKMYTCRQVTCDGSGINPEMQVKI